MSVWPRAIEDSLCRNISVAPGAPTEMCTFKFDNFGHYAFLSYIKGRFQGYDFLNFFPLLKFIYSYLNPGCLKKHNTYDNAKITSQFLYINQKS